MQLTDGITFLNETAAESKESVSAVSSEKEAEKANAYTEGIADFALDPVEFEEVSSRVMDRVDEIFDLTTRVDRFSPLFLTHCRQLETGVRYLAGAALTKAAFHDRNQEFPKLEQLSLNKLYMMVSWTFRKADAALSEKIKTAGADFSGLWNAEFSMLNLIKRLKASEEKIYNRAWIKYWDNNLIMRETMLTSKSWNKHYTEKHIQQPVFRQSPAFSPLQGTEAALRTMVPGEEISETGNQGPEAKNQGQGSGSQGSIYEQEKIKNEKNSEAETSVNESLLTPNY